MSYLKSCVVVVLIGAFSLPASAAIVTAYGTDVSFTYDDSTLFGTGTVVGNNIFFLTTNFKAESLNGEGVVSLDDTLDIQIEVTTANLVMTNFALAESGDYLLNGAGASVDVSGTLDIDSNTTAYSDSVGFTAGALTTQGSLTAWDLTTGVNLADTAGWEFDTDVNMSIYNVATATTTGENEQAFIEKKLEAAAVQLMVYTGPTTPVPVPAAVWLFGSGLAALGFVRRKRAKLL